MQYLSVAFDLPYPDGFLVDLGGRLVPVAAVTPRDARQLAVLAQGNEISSDMPVAIYRYHLAEDGTVVERVDA